MGSFAEGDTLMRADGQPLPFRFAMHDRVYLLGSAEPLIVLGQMTISMAASGEERRYYLRSTQGDAHWIDERHVYGTPTQQVAG
jgi:hypothetical protein